MARVPSPQARSGIGRGSPVAGVEPGGLVRRVAERLRARLAAPAERERAVPVEAELVALGVDQAHRAGDLVGPAVADLDLDVAGPGLAHDPYGSPEREEGGSRRP